MVVQQQNSDSIKQQASKIKPLLTDSDRVSTDGGVYYSDRGEELKRYILKTAWAWIDCERLPELTLELLRASYRSL